jgi:hypothetical protein
VRRRSSVTLDAGTDHRSPQMRLHALAAYSTSVLQRSEWRLPRNEGVPNRALSLDETRATVFSEKKDLRSVAPAITRHAVVCEPARPGWPRVHHRSFAAAGLRTTASSRSRHAIVSRRALDTLVSSHAHDSRRVTRASSCAHHRLASHRIATSNIDFDIDKLVRECADHARRVRPIQTRRRARRAADRARRATFAPIKRA